MGRLTVYLFIIAVIIGGVIYSLDWDKSDVISSPNTEFNINSSMLKQNIPAINDQTAPAGNTNAAGSANRDAAPVTDKTQTPPPAQMLLEKTKTYFVILKTDAGDIAIQLLSKETPLTANNFAYLANLHFYDNTIFHRVIKGFMIQGGDPLGNGTGGPAYKFADEKFSGSYARGTVAMANSGPDTNGSQFFIMQKDGNLPKNYVIFGKVVKGIEVVDKIAEAAVEDNGQGEKSKPVKPVTVLTTEIAAQ
jgi:cyclophilin family peptidyl-prolyl cis-trans isomerase